ncbi:MAG: hypothetical protein LBR38_03240, partial [Synergistaceae bacterium]|nr:hypothetical protein [Synergistaceae bacterium]
MGLLFELMSNGSAAELPEGASLPAGTPKVPRDGVLVLLPYNRYLMGRPFMREYERWVWGKLGRQPEEVYLYEGSPLTLTVDESAKITISSAAVSRLRAALMSRMAPPGEHLASALLLRSTLKAVSPLFANDSLIVDEKAFLRELAKEEGVVAMSYWAVRFALFRGDLDAVGRVKTCLQVGGSAFNSGDPPRIWFSLTPLPSATDLAEIEAMSFSLDDLQRMVSQSVLPVVLFSKNGYLILADIGTNAAARLRVWLFLPTSLWNELRASRKASIRDMIVASWGYRDATDAMAERLRYARPRGQNRSNRFPTGLPCSTDPENR